MNRRWTLVALSAVLWVAGLRAGADDNEKFQRRLDRLQQNTYDVAGNYPVGFQCELRVPEWRDNMDENARYKWGNAYIRLTRAGDRYEMRVEKLRDRSIEGFVNVALGLWNVAYAKELEITSFFMPASIMALAKQNYADFDYSEEQRDRMLKFGGRSTKKTGMFSEVEFIIDENWSLRAARLVFRDGATYTATYTHEKLPGGDGKWIVTGVDATLVDAKGVTRIFKITFSYQKVVKDETYWVYKKVVRELRDADGNLVKKDKNDANPVTYEYSDYTITDGPKAAQAEPQPPVGDLWQLVR